MCNFAKEIQNATTAIEKLPLNIEIYSKHIQKYLAVMFLLSTPSPKSPKTHVTIRLAKCNGGERSNANICETSREKRGCIWNVLSSLLELPVYM